MYRNLDITSINPSILFSRSYLKSGYDLWYPSNTLHFLLGDPAAFPGLMIYIILLGVVGLPEGTLPNQVGLENLHKEAPRRHPNWMHMPDKWHEIDVCFFFTLKSTEDATSSSEITRKQIKSTSFSNRGRNNCW